MDKKVEVKENKLSTRKQEIIERMAQFTERRGATPMNGRVFGFLLVAHQPKQDFFSICKSLDASKGAVSNALNELIDFGVVKFEKKEGGRKRYFYVDHEAWMETAKAELRSVTHFKVLIDDIIEIRGDDDFKKFREHLEHISEFYSVMSNRLEEFIADWEQEQQSNSA
ncbi:MAG TPA: hypothetical protein VJ917_10215 [Saprospiraceae bacterium]|nr:hypothetical protein [Saprospiraceae bacterium]